MGTVTGPRPSSGIEMTPVCTSARNASRSSFVMTIGTAILGLPPPDTATRRVPGSLHEGGIRLDCTTRPPDYGATRVAPTASVPVAPRR